MQDASIEKSLGRFESAGLFLVLLLLPMIVGSFLLNEGAPEKIGIVLLSGGLFAGIAMALCDSPARYWRARLSLPIRRALARDASSALMTHAVLALLHMIETVFQAGAIASGFWCLVVLTIFVAVNQFVFEVIGPLITRAHETDMRLNPDPENGSRRQQAVSE